MLRILLQKNSETIYQQELVERLWYKIYQKCGLTKNADNDIRLDAALNVLLYLTPKYAMTEPAVAQAVTVEVIKALWKI